jgi:WD repeat-containing protein 19
MHLCWMHAQYRDAADAYERGKDMHNVVRLCLEHLNSAQRAFSIVRETRSTESASMVARLVSSGLEFCEKLH